MGIRTVRTEGDECLRKVCKPVKSVSLRTRILIEDMFDTMYESGGVGLAAPQIGVLKRIVVMDTDDNQHVLINPQILEFSEVTSLGEEGCLSVPNQRAQVERAQVIRVLYHTLEGDVMETTFEGFPARIVQHEVDHLNGILFVDRLKA